MNTVIDNDQVVCDYIKGIELFSNKILKLQAALFLIRDDFEASRHLVDKILVYVDQMKINVERLPQIMALDPNGFDAFDLAMQDNEKRK